MSRIRLSALQVLVLCLGGPLSGCAHAADRGGWTVLRSSLDLPGSVRDVRLGDVDGDGATDLVVLHARERQRQLTVIWGDGAGRFVPSAPVALPADVAIADVGDVTSEPGDEILFLTSNGVLALGEEGRRLLPPRLVVEVPSFVLGAEDSEALFGRFVADLDGSGPDELLVQDFRSLRLLVRRGEAFELAAELPMPVKSSVANRIRQEDRLSPGTTRIVYTAVPLHVEDFDGDGRRDLGFLWKDELTVFFQEPAGFVEPDGRTPLRRLQHDFGVLKNDDQSVEPILTGRLVDLDGDGLLDAIFGIDQWAGTNKKDSRLWLFRGQRARAPGGGLAYPDKATQSLEIGAAMASTMQFDDLDTDGRQDVIVLGFHTGLMSLVRMFLSRGVTFHSWIHLQTAEGRLQTRAQEGHRLKLKLRFGGGTVTPIVEYADFDGDGRRDLVYGSDEDELSFYRATAEGVHDKAIATVAMSPYGASLPGRIAGGPGQDFVVYYPTSRELAGRVVVLLDRAAAPVPATSASR